MLHCMAGCRVCIQKRPEKKDFIKYKNLTGRFAVPGFLRKKTTSKSVRASVGVYKRFNPDAYVDGAEFPLSQE